MYSFICIQIVSGGLYAVIKLNVPLKAIGMEIDTACNFFPILLGSAYPSLHIIPSHCFFTFI